MGYGFRARTSGETNMGKTQILSALRAFVRQRPGLDFANYGDVQAYRAEVRSITKDLHHAEELIRAVELRSIDGEAIINAATSRLEIEQTDDGIRVHWCAGQYWPTEYRRGVAASLAYALWHYWRECGNDTGDKIRAEARRSLSRAVSRRFFR
jgi:hypothetical protein